MANSFADHIAPKGGRYEPVRQFDFFIQFQEFFPNMQFSVQSGNYPTITTEPIEVPYLNETRKVPGKITVEAGEFVIRDYIDPDIAEACYNWRQKVADVETGKIFRAAAFKTDGVLTTVDGEGNPIREWKVVGCWPSSVNFGSIDYSTSDQVQINMTIQYDKIEFTKKGR